MEKYGTYEIHENLHTGEKKNVLISDGVAMEKMAQEQIWVRREDLEIKEEKTQREKPLD